MIFERIPEPGPFASHAGFQRVFAKDKLTIGFILPIEGYPDGPVPTLKDHGRLTRLADTLDFAALWARDVPLLDPGFGDAGQLVDPYTYLGFLACNTSRIALATGSTVITLRHPLHVAKQAASVDYLSGGRMLLGVASGDRPIEYPAFGLTAEFESRGDRFREAFDMIRLAGSKAFPVGSFEHFGSLDGAVDTVPKPFVGRMPMFVTGRSRQTMDWIGANADGWFYYFVDLDQVEPLTSTWRSVVERASEVDVFKPFAHGGFFDLHADPDYSLERIRSGFRIGRNAMIEHLDRLERLHVNHVALNLKSLRRPAEKVMREIAEYVLPHFPSHAVQISV